jgi:hypothetical protein
MRPRHRLTTRLGPLAVVLALAACGDDFDPKSLLQEYRVLGIQAEPAELLVTAPGAVPSGAAPITRATLTAFDFDPASVAAAEEGAAAPTYAWSFCTLSKGSQGEYGCVEPLEEHAFGADGPSAVFDLVEQLPVLLADFCRLTGSTDCDDAAAMAAMAAASGGLESPISPLPIQIRLRAGDPVSGQVDAVKTLNLHLPQSPERACFAPVPNTNPRIKAFKIGGLDACPRADRREGCFLAAPAGSPILTLSVELEEGAAEEYQAGGYDEETQACVDESATETLFFSWYTTAGNVEFSYTNAETLENRLELPKSFPDDRAGPVTPVRVFVAVRDGRGGVDVRSGEFDLTVPSD